MTEKEQELALEISDILFKLFEEKKIRSQFGFQIVLLVAALVIMPKSNSETLDEIWTHYKELFLRKE